MCDVVGGFASPLHLHGALHLGRLGAAGLAEHGEQNHLASWRHPIRHSGLLAQQVESQLTDLPAEVAGVRLAERLGMLGEQADEEVDPAKVAISEAF